MKTPTQQQPIRIEMVGLLPTVFNLCSRCCTTDTLGACGIDLVAEQLRDYPPEVMETNWQAARLLRRLLRDYGGAVIPLAVSTTSLRGLWLSLRHRLPASFSIVVNGRRVVPGDADYDCVKQAIEQELQTSMAGPGQAQ
jgi:hypothetical protein